MTIGGIRDRANSSFVESPARGAPFAAREVVVANTAGSPANLFIVSKVQSVFSESLLSPATNTVVVTKIFPPSNGGQLVGVNFSGQNPANITVLVNGSVIDTGRTHWTEYNLKIDLCGKTVSPSDVIEVAVENRSYDAALFNVSLYYQEL